MSITESKLLDTLALPQSKRAFSKPSEIATDDCSKCQCGSQGCIACLGNFQARGSVSISSLKLTTDNNPKEENMTKKPEKAKKSKKSEKKKEKQQSQNPQPKNDANKKTETNDTGQEATNVAKKNADLSKVRIIQKNLVYVIGLSEAIADEKILEKPEYFGQYGNIVKIAVNKVHVYNSGTATGPSYSAYITYSNEIEASTAILAVNKFTIHERVLSASFGTTKYCSHFLKHQECLNSECLYLHEISSDTDSFVKDTEINNKSMFQYLQKIAAKTVKSSSAKIIKAAKEKKFKSVLPPASTIGNKVKHYKSNKTKAQAVGVHKVSEIQNTENYKAKKIGNEEKSNLQEGFSAEFDPKKAFFRPEPGAGARRPKINEVDRYEQFEVDIDNICGDDDDYDDLQFQFPRPFEPDFNLLDKFSESAPIALSKTTTMESNPLGRNDNELDKKIIESLLTSNEQSSSRFGFAQQERLSDEDMSYVVKESIQDCSREINALETSYSTLPHSDARTSISSKSIFLFEDEKSDSFSLRGSIGGFQGQEKMILPADSNPVEQLEAAILKKHSTKSGTKNPRAQTLQLKKPSTKATGTHSRVTFSEGVETGPRLAINPKDFKFNPQFGSFTQQSATNPDPGLDLTQILNLNKGT